MQAARAEREKAQRHVVGPVAVFQEDHERLTEGDAPEQMREGFEDAQLVGGTRLHRLAGVDELGEQAGELGAPAAFQVAQQVRIGRDAGVAQRADQGPQRQDLLALVGAPEHDPTAAAAGLGG